MDWFKVAFWSLYLALVLSSSSCLIGCGSTREAAKAATMADQSLEAAQDQLEHEPMPIDQGSEAMIAWATKAYDRVLVARKLLAPVRARLAVGVAPAELATGTSADMARHDPQAFDAKADAQVIATVAEVEAAGFWDRLGVIARGVLKTAASSSLGLALGGTGAATILTAVVALVPKLRKWKAIAEEAITYGDEATAKLKEVGGESAARDIQKDAVERQAKRGVWRHIDKASKVAKARRLAAKATSTPANRGAA